MNMLRFGWCLSWTTSHFAQSFSTCWLWHSSFTSLPRSSLVYQTQMKWKPSKKATCFNTCRINFRSILKAKWWMTLWPIRQVEYMKFQGIQFSRSLTMNKKKTTCQSHSNHTRQWPRKNSIWSKVWKDSRWKIEQIRTFWCIKSNKTKTKIPSRASQVRWLCYPRSMTRLNCDSSNNSWFKGNNWPRLTSFLRGTIFTSARVCYRFILSGTTQSKWWSLRRA